MLLCKKYVSRWPETRIQPRKMRAVTVMGQGGYSVFQSIFLAVALPYNEKKVLHERERERERDNGSQTMELPAFYLNQLQGLLNSLLGPPQRFLSQ